MKNRMKNFGRTYRARIGDLKMGNGRREDGVLGDSVKVCFIFLSCNTEYW